MSDLKKKSEDNRPVENDESKIKSLEEKSKSSRARVHYRKFTRGKDLTNATKVDLDCILGRHKRKIKVEERVEEDSSSSSSSSSLSSGSTGKDQKPESTFITKTSALSMNDYFAAKMAEIAKRKNNNVDDCEKENKTTEIEVEEEKVVVDEEPKVKKKKKDKQTVVVEVVQEVEKQVEEEEPLKKKKDKQTIIAEVVPDVETQVEEEEPLKKKKKKKKKSKEIEEESNHVEETAAEGVDDNNKKYKTFKESLYKIEDPFNGSNLFDVVGYTPYTVFQNLDTIIEDKKRRMVKKCKITERNLRINPNYYANSKLPSLNMQEVKIETNS